MKFPSAVVGLSSLSDLTLRVRIRYRVEDADPFQIVCSSKTNINHKLAVCMAIISEGVL